mgnify:CR=1 FL=1
MNLSINRRHFCGLVAGASIASICPTCVTKALSPSEEKYIGQQNHPKIIKEYGGVYDDPKVSGYFALIASRLVRATNSGDVGFRFTLLNSPEVNAFALPGGYIYITRGLVALASDEAEIAGVIGHEIGHVIARHTSKRIAETERAKRDALAVGLLGAVLGTQGLGDAAVGLAQRRIAGFSQEQEHEADVLGVRYMGRAGYNPDGLANFLENLRAHSQLNAVISGLPPGTVDSRNMLSSHPRTVERVHRSIRHAKIVRGGWQLKYRKQFLKNIDGITFGDDPKHGVLRGRIFMHPALRFRIQVPRGFDLENTENELIARGPHGSGIILDFQRTAFQGSMLNYLSNGWAHKIRLNDLEKVRINNMDSATGWAEVKSKKGNIILRPLAVRYSRERIFRFLFISPKRMAHQLTRKMRNTAYSFRRLSKMEAEDIRPYAVRVEKVQNSISVREMSSRMMLFSHKEDWLRVLNSNIRGSSYIKQGEMIKLIV